jgi:hypothetical protein
MGRLEKERPFLKEEGPWLSLRGGEAGRASPPQFTGASIRALKT